MKYCALSLFLLLCGCASRGGSDATIQVTHHIDLSVLLNWVIVASVLGLAVSIAALIWLPIQRWISLFGVTMFGLCIAGALTVETILPWLPWIVLGLFAAALVIGVFYLRSHHVELRELSELFDKDDRKV